MKKTIGLLILSCAVMVGTGVQGKVIKAKPSKAHASTIEWENFTNKRNHFEFEKPKCFEVDGQELPAETSNFVRVTYTVKCKDPSIQVREFAFTSPPGVSLIDPKNVLSNNYSRVIDKSTQLGNRRGVLTAKVYKDKDRYRVDWTIYSRCNGKNLYLGFNRFLEMNEVGAAKKGKISIPPMIKHVMDTYKCHKY